MLLIKKADDTYILRETCGNDYRFLDELFKNRSECRVAIREQFIDTRWKHPEDLLVEREIEKGEDFPALRSDI